MTEKGLEEKLDKETKLEIKWYNWLEPLVPIYSFFSKTIKNKVFLGKKSQFLEKDKTHLRLFKKYFLLTSLIASSFAVGTVVQEIGKLGNKYLESRFYKYEIPKRINSHKNQFDKLDKNYSGFIEPDEFIKVMNNYDINKDNTLSLEEFARFKGEKLDYQHQ